jgi:hypothetical protein
MEIDPRPRGQKSINVKWIFKENNNAKREVKRYKARLVTKDYSQKHETDYDKVFALIVILETI